MTRAIRRKPKGHMRSLVNPKDQRMAEERTSAILKYRKQAQPLVPPIIENLVERAIAGDNGAAGILLDRLWPKSTITGTPLTTQLNLALGTAADIQISMKRVTLAIATREIGLDEGKALLDILERLLTIEHASAIDEIRAEIDGLKRAQRGGVRVINAEVEGVPTWGQAGKRYLASLGSDEQEVEDG